MFIKMSIKKSKRKKLRAVRLSYLPSDNLQSLFTQTFHCAHTHSNMFLFNFQIVLSNLYDPYPSETNPLINQVQTSERNDSVHILRPSTTVQPTYT